MNIRYPIALAFGTFCLILFVLIGFESDIEGNISDAIGILAMISGMILVGFSIERRPNGK